jgi:6-phosphofructo-2-kinase/fructose-2,6-biphosphatase 2
LGYQQEEKHTFHPKVLKEYAAFFLFLYFLLELYVYLVSRYLTWLGIKTQIFSVGNYRRKLAGLNLPHTFFDVHNEEAVKKRHEAAAMALNDMIQWFSKEDGTVGILDATNSTKKARAWINQELTSRNIQVLFIESICDDENIILHNIKDVKLSSPDYCNRDSEAATEDFMKRIGHYEACYETITEQDLTYIKLINVGSQYIINMIRGYLESRIVYYLMNLHTRPKRIWFSRVSLKYVYFLCKILQTHFPLF